MAIELVADFDALLPEGPIANISFRSVYFHPLLRPRDQPLLIGEGRKSFLLDKESGKKCYMISARELTIIWGDTPKYWRWINLPEGEARFEEVAELLEVCWLEIRGKIDISMLSPSTLYTANLVFKSLTHAYGFSKQAADATVGLVGGERFTRKATLDTKRKQRQYLKWDSGHNYPKKRGDGWMETELGEFFYGGGQDGELEMSLLDPTTHWKSGLIIQGIEIRPKQGNKSHSASTLIVQGNEASQLSRSSSSAPSFFSDDIED